MKENKYDDQAFFDKYKMMNRSQLGLQGAGEWEDFRKLIPPLHDKAVLDLGCGYGWHCIYAMEQGAKSVIGVDISQKMLNVAIDKTKYKEVKYICGAIEDIQFEENTFDVVISSLAFHYIENFTQLVIKMNRCLKDKGQFVFSVEHPIFTSLGTQDWIYDSNGAISHFPVDNYFNEGKRNCKFLGESVVKYHRTVTNYANTLLNNGFIINQIVEPTPSQHLLDTIPDMKHELRRPMMFIISATKK